MEKEISTYEEFLTGMSEGEVLIDFYATWCGPCRMIAPIVAKIAEGHPELSVLRVDVDKVPQAAAKFGVNSIPTLVHMKDGTVLGTKIGFAPEAALLSWLGK